MISLRNVTKSYDYEILFNIENVDLSPGVYLISGENGVGKSTLMNIISGTCEYQGKVDLGDVKEEQISYINQNLKLFRKLTIKENLNILLCDDQNKKVTELANILKFDEVLKTNKKISKLSGGERQKLQLIIGLLRDSEILILDEFDNNLDLDSTSKIINLLSSMNKQYIFVISHNPKIVNQIIDYNLRIEDNKISVSSVSDNNAGQEADNSPNTLDTNGNKKKLNKSNCKYFSRYNKFNYLVVIVSLFVSLFIIYNIVSVVSLNMIDFAQVETTPFADDVSIITAPRYTEQYQHLGDESWLETTEYGFTQDQYDKLLGLNYVDEAIFIQNPYSFTSLGSIKYGDQYLDFSEESQMETIDLQSIDYDKLATELDGIEITPQNDAFISFNQLEAPAEVYQTTPLSLFGYSASQLIYGQTPSDESNEIAIDIYIAAKIAQDRGVAVSDLIGEEVTINLDQKDVENYQTLGNDDYTFKIAGIYNTTKPGIITYSYHQDSLNTEEGVCNNPQSLKAIENCKYTLAANPLSQDISYMDDFPNTPLSDYGIGMSIYVKTEPGFEQQLKEDVATNDQYIEVDNNYTRTHNETSQAFYKLVKENIVYMLLTIFALIVIMIIMFTMIKRTLTKQVVPVLSHYNFEQNSLIILMKQQKRKLLSLVIICELIFMIIFIIYVKFHFSIFMLTVASIFIILTILVSIVLKIIR